MSLPFTVCVFCASSEAVAPRLRAVAVDLGRAIAERGWGLVYGGGNVGLMGEVARSALRAGAHVTGVIPHRLAERELALRDLTDLVYTNTMRERKHHMDERSDAFVVLPGGVGTLEELVEIITLKQLGYHQRAIVLLDPDGFWEPLLAQFDRIVERRLARSDLRDLWTTVRAVDEAVHALATYKEPPLRVPAPVEVEEAAVDGSIGVDTNGTVDEPDGAPAQATG